MYISQQSILSVPRVKSAFLRQEIMISYINVKCVYKYCTRNAEDSDTNLHKASFAILLFSSYCVDINM